MTNETQEARALLESQIAACAAAQERFGALKEVLQKDVSGEGVSAAAIAAERSLADIRGIERRQNFWSEQDRRILEGFLQKSRI